MQREEIQRSLHQACGNSPLLKKGLLTLMDWLTGQSWHVRRELRKWYKTSPVPAHVLDLGNGYSHHAYWLSSKCRKVSILAIDPTPENVCRGNAYVRETGMTNLLFKTADIEGFEANNAFDLILCTDVLSHVKDQDLLIKNLHQALKDDGFIMATVKRTSANVKLQANGEGVELNELKQLFRSAGFKKVKGHYTGGSAGQTARKLGVSIPLLLLHKSRLFVVLMPFYYLLITPIAIVMNWIDSRTAQMSGRGLLILARK